MDKFVVGFAFTKSRDQVLLMTKGHPEWQKGLLDGVGGKRNFDKLKHAAPEGPWEDPLSAMWRECAEETGLRLLEWECRGVMEGKNNDGRRFTCHIFYAYDDDVMNFKQMEDEPLALYEVSAIPGNIVSCLEFLIPFGVSDDRPFMTLMY